jgi:hypothetical protein
MVHLLVAHPGHELLLHGWIHRTKPAVHILTDGSAHSSTPRLAQSAELLRDAGARPGALFGRLTDREAYAMILEGNAALLLALAKELTGVLERERPAMIVADAAEGYNPVHDLCRLVAGAAVAMAGVNVELVEYAVAGRPYALDASMAIDLDDAEYAAKIERAARYAATLTDIGELLSRHGAEAYRREAFRRVADWTALDGDAPPLYERFGEERVAAGRYRQVIRRDAHLRPLRDALRAAVEKRSCAF